MLRPRLLLSSYLPVLPARHNALSCKYQPNFFAYSRNITSTTNPIKPSVATIISQYATKLRKAAFFLDDLKSNKETPNLADLQESWASGLRLIDNDMGKMTQDIVNMLVGSVVQPTHPLLAKIASYYFELKGKRLRPAIVLLISHAVNPTTNITPSSVTTSKPTQLQLAEVVEMMHTASLIHDDVLDDALTRRDMPSANAQFGNKLAIMAGDFLLAKASISLARLQNCEVTELMATVLGELIEGEFMQLRGSSAFDYYLRKTYLKTASLLANGCRSAAVLSGASRDVVELSTEYGKNIGLAFQIIDDLLDFTGSTEELGKPAAVDLSLGLATGPVLYAREEFPELETLISRKFSTEGDIARARELVNKSKGIERTMELAKHYSKLAAQSISSLPPSQARDALLALPDILLTRSR